jgi:hypothetical protein
MLLKRTKDDNIDYTDVSFEGFDVLKASALVVSKDDAAIVY